MYNKILADIKEPYYIQNFDNDGQRFVAWYLRNIHLRDLNQTKDDITDGTDDKQIDAIVIDDDNSTVYIIQGKFIGSGNVDSGPLREVLASWLQLRNLVRLQEVGNAKLKRKLADVARAFEDEYEVSFELITTSALTKAATDDLDTFQKELSELSAKSEFDARINLVDDTELKRRYELALDRENPKIKHTVQLAPGKYVQMKINDANVVIATIELKETIKIPGINDGTLFRKNVRQSLGLNNVVNKGIRETIYNEKENGNFFFYHNGITAIANKMKLDGDMLYLDGLSVVNGCQSLNTILSCSEHVKTLHDARIMFRFYEIPQRDRADRISINTNTQSAVKPRDLRSNHGRVLNLKRNYEQKYPNGYLATKRGEQTPADKDKNQVIDLAQLGKYLMSWHSQRPNIAYSETKIFDKYFDQLFKRDYKPEDIHALNGWMQKVSKCWTKDNPLQLNETLLAMKAYAPYHQLYGVSMCFAIASNQNERAPSPSKCYKMASENGTLMDIVNISGTCLNIALETAASEQQTKVFSPHNWVKAKTCLTGIRFAIRNYFTMLPSMPGGKEQYEKLKTTLTLNNEDFEDRWTAD